jgi:hypothetical protein
MALALFVLDFFMSQYARFALPDVAVVSYKSLIGFSKC